MSNAAVFAFLTLLYSCRVCSASDHLSRNYASNECGAKVIAANAEAEGTNKILSESRDEYMLNPCSAKIWFVVELCEPILPSVIELANFELYSSTPKELQIDGSDKYPTPEWQLMGSFVASDSRELQRFPIHLKGSYVKFIRVQLLSYYGSQHFCPFSLIRAFGVSLVEEFDAIENGASPPHISLPAPDVLSPQLLLHPEQQPQTRNPVQEDSAVSSNESINVGPDSTGTFPQLTPNGGSDPPAEELGGKLDGLHQKPEPGCKGQELLFGPQIHSLCDKRSEPSLYAHPIPSPTPTVSGNAAGDAFLSATPIMHDVTQINGQSASELTHGFGQVSSTDQASGTQPSVRSPEANDALTSASAGTIVTVQSTDSSAATAPVPSMETGAAANGLTVPNSLVPEPTATTGSPAASPVESLVVPVTAIPVPLSVIGATGPLNSMNDTNSGIGSVIAASSSKESIFIRLNNRIKALELNMTLNRDTIDTLSRRQLLMEQQVTELLNRSQMREDEGQRLVLDLQLRLTDISEQVYLLVSEKEVFHWQLIQVHILLMVIEIALIIMIMSSYMKNLTGKQQVMQLPIAGRENVSSHPMTPLPPANSSVTAASQPLALSASVRKHRLSPDKDRGLHVEHPPITGSSLLKKRKRRKKNKNPANGLTTTENQENVEPQLRTGDHI